MENPSNIPDDEFMKDAEEGLSAVNDPNRLAMIVDQINHDLHKKLEQKKARKNKRNLKEYPWIYLAVGLILFLIIIAYWIIHKLTFH